MRIQRSIEHRYKISKDVVAREIEGEFIIVPVTSAIEADEDALFSLNKTGKAIWERIDGEKTVRVIAQELSGRFDASLEEIESHIQGFIKELLRRKMILRVKK